VVQNEFDGGGTHLRIAFGPEGLTVTGSGKPINRKGWRRLDVLMGTGDVLGDENGEVVESKENGIGSKNFGLRSLFLFGDRIFVHSNGRVAILDCAEMATGQQPDPNSVNKPGVTLHVPYRLEPRRSLQAFTVEREAKAFDDIAQALLPTLLKLALSGKRPGITRLEVTSVRTQRRLIWQQSAKPVACGLNGVSAVRRIGRFTDERATGEPMPPAVFDEIEYSRVTPVPAEHADVAFPSYYRSPKGVRICVSLPLRRNRVAIGTEGYFYYPLQAPQGRTGSTASVSAPFKLDPDRTQLIDNDWNRWLCARAADLAGELLVTEWFHRFEGDGYTALADTGPANPGDFRVHVTAGLRDRPCWPTRSRNPSNDLHGRLQRRGLRAERS
jgi:hypothetical protein